MSQERELLRWRSIAASTAPITMPARSPAMPPSNAIALTNHRLMGDTTMVEVALIVTIQQTKTTAEIADVTR